MYACLPVCTHVFISLHLSLCVCKCVYMCVYMERDIGRSVVKEKPPCNLSHMVTSSPSPNSFFLGTLLTQCLRVTQPVVVGTHLQDTPLGFLGNGLLVNIC